MFDQDTARFLLSSANHALLGGDLLEVISGVMGYQAGTCANGAREVRIQVRSLLSAYARLADRLSLSGATEAEPGVSLPALRQAELGCLRRWQTDAGVGRGAKTYDEAPFSGDASVTKAARITSATSTTRLR